jgi:GntR family transcriptional repressor for pyruvate dehydrogenase complex
MALWYSGLTTLLSLHEAQAVDEKFDFSIRRDRLYEQVTEQLQDLIVTESLRPGDKLPGERDLAERLGVSRTVIREAIRVLGVRGLVKVKPGCGTYIQELSPKDAAAPIELFLRLRQAPDSFDHLYEIRRMIEVEAAGLAAERATEEDHAAMEAAIEGMVAHQDDPERFTQYDLAFHTALAGATHNELFSVLLSPIANLWVKVVLISVHAPGATEDGVNYHRQVLRCVKERDSEKARQAMRAHIRHSQGLAEAVRQQVRPS